MIGEPLYLSFEQIGRLTDKQIADICNHARDDQGRLKEALQPLLSSEDEEDEAPVELSKEEKKAALWRIGRQMGMSESKIAAAWKRKYPDG